MQRIARGGLITAALVLGLGAGAARAGEAEIALLFGLVDGWRGNGTLVSPEEASPFECTLTISRGNRGKVVFGAKCPFVVARGGIGYNDATSRYEIAMTSTTDFGTVAFGSETGGSIHFPIKGSDTDSEDNFLDLDADLRLGAEAIRVTFVAKLNGDPYSGELTFTR